MAAETTETPLGELFNSSAFGGADGGAGSVRGAADPVPARRAASSRCKKDLESQRKRGSWTAAEDAELRAYVAKYGVGNWKHVADAAPALKRDAQSCRLRWSSYLDPKVPRVAALRLRATMGEGGCQPRALHFKERRAAYCERCVNRTPFTPDEDALLLASVAWGSHGETKWAAIASAKFPSRTGYQIQSRWHSLVNKQRRRFDQLVTTSKGEQRPPSLEGAGANGGEPCPPDPEARTGGGGEGYHIESLVNKQRRRLDQLVTTSKGEQLPPSLEGAGANEGELSLPDAEARTSGGGEGGGGGGGEGYQIDSLVNKQRRRFDQLVTTPNGRPAGNTTITTTTVNPSVAVREQSAGNTTITTTTVNPSIAVREQSARNSAADAIVTGTDGKEILFLLEGATASGAVSGAGSGAGSVAVSGAGSGALYGVASGAISGAASGGSLAVVAGGASGATAGGFPGGSPGIQSASLASSATAPVGATPTAATPSTVAASIQTLQSAINGLPQTSYSGICSEPSTSARASAATPSTVAAFIQALQSATNGRDHFSNSTTTLPYPTTHVITPVRHSTTLRKATQPNSTHRSASTEHCTSSSRASSLPSFFQQGK
ncbi:unnamed protein product [Closterium sp. Naga37s-1]|nr:unnamed protein product [Closterium sp. Naga37s-1]